VSGKPPPEIPRAELERILGEEEVGVLCLADGAEPYGVPLSYAFLDGRIVFHCAARGRKLDILRRNDRATFIVYRSPDRTVPHAEGDCSVRFESVFAFGRARIVEDPAERFALLRRFQQRFDARLGRETPTDPVTEKAAAKTGCVEISIESLTGRRKGAPAGG
jgi:uncharacterized protein